MKKLGAIFFLAISCGVMIYATGNWAPPAVSTPIYIDQTNHVWAPGSGPLDLQGRGLTNVGVMSGASVRVTFDAN